MQVSSILTEAKDVLGKCDLTTVYKRITDAVRLANANAKGNDWNIAEMDLTVCDGCVTLPADVGTVLAVNRDGWPTLMRDQWYQYHINGAGSCAWRDWAYTDEVGQVCTYRDPSEPVKLVANVETAADSNCLLRVYGWDADGKRIYTPDDDNVLQDGFLVPTTFGFSIPSSTAPAIGRIDRIIKAETQGFVQLVAVDPDTLESVNQIGYYLPWETTPSYRRIRVPDESWIRIKYRRKDLEVRSSSDWINIENREALLLLLKAVKFRLDNALEQGRAYEAEGLRLLSAEAEMLRPPSVVGPQINWDGANTGYGEDRLIY